MPSDSENPGKKKVPVRSSRGGSKSGRQRSSRQKPAGGGANKAVIAGVLTLVVIAGAAFALGVFDGEPKKDDNKQPEKVAEKETPKKESASSSIFDASTAQKDPDAPKKRERVTGRAPKTIDLKKTVSHLGHLYMSDELSAKVKKLEKDVTEFERERWDISDELKAEHKAIEIEISRAKADRFLSGADDDLRAFNTYARRTDIHRKDEAGNLMPEPFIGTAHEPFVFMVQASTEGGEKEIADEVYDWMVQLKAEFVRYFDGSIKLEPKDESRIRIILFRKYKDYATYNRMKNPDRDRTFALAHYEPDTRRLCVPLDFGAMGGKDKKHSFREVMFHEGTHQVMHYFTNSSHLGSWGSMWSDEGVAEYFAGHCIDPEDGKIKFGRINTRIRAVAADNKDPKRRISMTQLLTWTRFKMAQERERGAEKERIAQVIHSHVYSQGWAMVYFFNNFKDGIYKPKFMEIMKRQIGKSGDSGLPVWRQIFSEEEFDKIEVEYFDYLDYLTDAFNNNKIVNHTLVD